MNDKVPYVPSGAADAIRLLLRFIGEDVDREGLKDTPHRVMRSYAELFKGYSANIPGILKTFDGGDYEELVILKDIEFTSFCEHHVLPFSGKAHIGYFPNGRIVGISKLARLLEAFSRRLQVQERITTQITSALDEYLQPKGSACVLEASHQCMTCRGVGKQNSIMVTSSLTGCLRNNPDLRAEFFSLVRS